MGGLVFIAVRRLRAPLILILVVFAVSTAGFALIPGQDDAGLPRRPSLFEAFYVVSYTATTIGFGEVPFAFTTNQRLWATVVIYLSVICWTFLLGSLLGLAQDKGLRAAMVAGRFDRAVRGLREPFYLLCGLGETGLTVARALDRMGRRFVAIDVDESRALQLDLGDFATDPLEFAGDAASPDVLRMAGLLDPRCRGVLALTGDDRANLAIAVAAKLLNPRPRVIARAHDPAVVASMETLGVDEILNPFREFAERLAIAMRAPDSHRLLTWLTDPPGARLALRLPDAPGRWIVCGYGRFGAEIVRVIRDGGFDVTIVDPDCASSDGLRVVAGLATDDDTLIAAGAREADGLVAGTDDDTANLVIAIAARAMNPDLVLILRQNHVRNAALFAAFGADMVMVPSEIIANECVAMLETRHVSEFLSAVRTRDNAWSAAFIEQLLPILNGRSPEFWSCALTENEAPGLLDAMDRAERPARLDDLLRDIGDRRVRTPGLALLLVRAGLRVELPDPGTELAPGDDLLFAGDARARRQLLHTLRNANTAHYVLTGQDPPAGPVGRLLRPDGAGPPQSDRGSAR